VEQADGVIFLGYNAYSDINIYSWGYEQYILHASQTKMIQEFMFQYEVLMNKVAVEEVEKYVLKMRYTSSDQQLVETKSDNIEMIVILCFWCFIVVKWVLENRAYFYQYH